MSGGRTPRPLFDAGSSGGRRSGTRNHLGEDCRVFDLSESIAGSQKIALGQNVVFCCAGYL